MPYAAPHEALCATASANSPQKAVKLHLLIGALRSGVEERTMAELSLAGVHRDSIDGSPLRGCHTDRKK